MVLEFIADFAAYGYAGVFAVSLIGSATIFFPVPYFVVIFGLAPVLDPIVLVIVAALGSAIGELVGFYLGRAGEKAIHKRHWKWFETAEWWFKRHGFLTLIFLSAAPLVADVGGLMAGTMKYDRGKFLVAMFIGKIVKFAVIVAAGYYSLGYVLAYFGIA